MTLPTIATKVKAAACFATADLRYVWYAGRLHVVDARDGDWLTVTPMGARGPLTSQSVAVSIDEVERTERGER